MAGKGKPMGSGGRPGGRIGKGGIGPASGSQAGSGGSPTRGTKHSGNTRPAKAKAAKTSGSGSATKSVVIFCACLFGVPFLLVVGAVGYVIAQ